MRKAQNQITLSQALFFSSPRSKIELDLTHNGPQTCNWDWIYQHSGNILSKIFIVYFWEKKSEVPKLLFLFNGSLARKNTCLSATVSVSHLLPQRKE